MNDHQGIEEMMAARALGGLSASDEAELELLRAEHGRDCEECLRLEAVYGEVSGRLAFALDPQPVRPEMADEILDRADERAEAPPAGRAGVRPARGRRLVAAATAAAILVAGGVGGYVIGHSGAQSSEVQAVAGFVSDPAARVVHLSGSGTGKLSLAYQPGRRSAFLFGTDVPATPAGKVYELWRFGRSGPPIPSGTFTASGAVVVLHVAADLSKAKTIAVTVERAPGAKQPTTSPIYSALVTS